MVSGVFQSTNALTTLSKHRFSCRVHWGGNGRATNLLCFHHGGEEFWYSRHIILPSKRHYQKQAGGGNLKLCKLTWRNRIGCPAQPGLIRLAVRPSAHACRLGIERRIAQVQQIQSIILQNHESTRNVNQKFFKKKHKQEKHSK